MKKYTLDSFNELVSLSSLKPRVKRELRFTTSTEHLTDEDWADAEIVKVTDRSGSTGAVLIEIDGNTYLQAAEFKRGITSSSTGRAQPIICDFCKTWQSGDRAGSVLFTNVNGAARTVGYLCCADLECSQHVRSKTSASKMSRAQLREDMTTGQRIERLKAHLRAILSSIDASPIAS